MVLRYALGVFGTAAVVGSVALLASCSKDGSSNAFDFAAIAPIVTSATPAGLKASTRSAWFKLDFLPEAFAANASYSNVKNSLTGMFKGTFGKISGGNGIGYINSNLEDLDSRVSELEGRFKTLPSCFSAALGDLNVDFANHADAKLALKVNCRDEFSSTGTDQSKPGSGMVFGRRAKTETVPELISLTLLLKHKSSSSTTGGTDANDAGFGYAGTILGAGTDDEAVELLFGQFNNKSGLATSDEDQPLMARIYTKTKTKEFEVALAGAMPGGGSPISGGSSALGCGLRLISDGTLIVGKGIYVASGTCVSGTRDTVDVCVDATTLADVSTTSSAACATLAAKQFHIASSASSLSTFDYQTVTTNTVTASNSILNALKPGSTAVTAITTSVSN